MIGDGVLRAPTDQKAECRSRVHLNDDGAGIPIGREYSRHAADQNLVHELEVAQLVVERDRRTHVENGTGGVARAPSDPFLPAALDRILGVSATKARPPAAEPCTGCISGALLR